MSDRSWRLTARSLVRMVRDGTITAEQAIDDMELALLNDASPVERDRHVTIGTIELGSWHDAFERLANLARYRYARFFGWARRNVFVGVLLGTDGAADDEVRRARIDELRERER